jgi:hypothetical protein
MTMTTEVTGAVASNAELGRAPKRGTVDYAEWLAGFLHNGGDYGKEAAELLVNQAKALEYLTAGREQRAPAWVPDRVMLTREVRGDYPIGHQAVAEANVYTANCNRWGAVSVRAGNGSQLGMKPGEFEVVRWRANEKA